MDSEINACQAGAFPMMVEEDEDESPHVNMDKVQDSCLAFDNDLDSKSMTSLLRRMTMSSW
jgi:hypothetical protein